MFVLDTKEPHLPGHSLPGREHRTTMPLNTVSWWRRDNSMTDPEQRPRATSTLWTDPVARVALSLSIILFCAAVVMAEQNPFSAALQLNTEDALFVCKKDFVAFATLNNDRPGFIVIRKKFINAVLFESRQTIVLLSSSRPPAAAVSPHTGKLISHCLGVGPRP